MSELKRKYVLRGIKPINRANGCTVYYTGRAPARQIRNAKIFSLKDARSARQFLHTGAWYEIIKVTDKQIFNLTLKGL